MNRTRLALTAFFAILQRDLVVTAREFIPFLLQALMQPLFILFIFGKVLPGIGLATGNFAGQVWMQRLITERESPDVEVLVVSFEAGGRTRPH